MRSSRNIVLIFIVFLLSGCSMVPTTKNFSVLDPQVERDTVYIVPFDATLVPPDVGDPVFDEFVDILKERRKQTKVSRFLILKDDLKSVEPAWLINQIYISGDIWGYVEKSGCCSTEMKVKSRISLHEPGKEAPTFEVFVPVEHYFDHDRSTITAAKTQLGTQLSRALAEAVLKKLTP